MGSTCSVGSGKVLRAPKNDESVTGKSNESTHGQPNDTAKTKYFGSAFENWLSSSILKAQSKHFEELSMPTGLKVLFEDILSRMPEERPYVEPETSAELRKRLKKNLLDSDRGNQPGIIRETLSEEEASSGRYMRLFVWSNYEATLVHQALHQIVIPKIADCCKRVGICMVWVDFRWAASSSLTEESDTPFLSRKKFVEIQEMVESEMERCFCMSPLLNFLSIIGAQDFEKTEFELPLRVPNFVISRWIKASRTLAAEFIKKAYPKYNETSNPMELSTLDTNMEDSHKESAKEIANILESVCSGGSSSGESVAITNSMIASLTSDPTESILRRRMKLELGSDSGLFPLKQSKSMMSYCYSNCLENIVSARSSIAQKKPTPFAMLMSDGQQHNESRLLEPMSKRYRWVELLFDLRNNVQFFHTRNDLTNRNLLAENVSHFCSSSSDFILERLKLAILEREKFLPGVLEGRLHFRLMRDAVLNKSWDTAMVAIIQLCWLPDAARSWKHPSPTITNCLLSEKRMLESKEKFNEKDIFISAAQGFSSKFYDSEYNSAAISALNDDFVETNFWRLLDEKKKLEGTLTKKQIREKQQAMQISAKKMFQQDVSQVEADAKMSELKQEISESLASMVEDFGLIADVMSIKRHGCILIYDPGDSCAVSSIMNAIGVLKAKITSSISWRENQTFNIITRGAMLDDTVCNFPDLVTSICEELAGKSITVCNQIQFLQSDFTNHSEALKLSAFIQMIPEEQPTVIFCYGLQNINRTERLSAEICPEKVPPWVLLILHAVCAPSRAAETLIRSSFRGKCEIFGSLSQSPRNSFVAMVEQLFIARCTPLDAQALSLCKSVYCGKHGVLTTKCHIMMFAKCLEWDVFDDDSGLLKLSSELRDQPNQVIVKYYILGVIKKFRFSMISTFAALSLMAASKCEVPFATIVAFTKFVKTQNKDTLMKGFSVRPSMRKKDVLDVLSKIQQAITIEEVCVKTTEWNLFFEHFKILMTPTIILRGSQECFALNDGILKLDVQTVTGAILSQSFSKTVLLAIRYYEPWHIEQRARDEQISNVMKYRDLMPMVMELGLQAFALDLLLDFDFVSHYVDEGYSRQLEVFYLQASEFLDCTELLQQSATILRDIQRFLAHNRTLFLSGIKYDFLSLLFNFNGGSKYFEAVMKFRETKRQKGDEVNSVWVINRSEYGKRDTLRWISEARGEVRAWYLMNELESRYCAISIDMPEPRLMILNAVTGQPLWTSPQNLISESQIKIKSSNDNVYLVSCSKAKVYLWKKTGTYAESGYAAVYSFQLLKCDISGFDLSPNDSNFCTYNDTEGLTVTAWSIVMNTANIDKLDHLNIAATSVYHVGLSSILKFACFLSWENVLLTSESNGQLTLLYIHKSSFGLTTNPGSSLSEIIRWNIPNSHATERRASSMQWLKDRNVLVLYDLDFVIFYELILNFDDVGCPVAKVSALKSLQNGFAPGNWYSSPMISVTIVDPRMPELNMNLTDKSLDDTLIAIILTEKNICVWSTQPYNNLPEQILVEFSSKESRIAQIILNKAGCLILNCSDRSIVQRVLEIARYGMIDNSPANGCIDDIHFTSDDSMIICSCKSGEVSLYSGTSGLLKVCQMMNQSGISFCSAFSCLVGIAYSGDHDGNICCYNVKAKAKLPNLKYHQCAVTAMVVSQSELMLASGDSEGNLIIWSTRSGQILLRIPEAHSDSITQVKFSPDSSTLWSSSLDGRVASWMCTNGQGLQASRVSDVTAQSFDISANILWLTNSRKLIATCGNDYTTKVWYIPLESVEDEISLSRTKPCFKLRVQCVKFERSFLHSVVFAKKDASIVAASCANGMIRLFNTTDGSVMLTINLSGVTRLAISSKYEFLALATNSGRCSVFTLHYDD